MEGVRSTPTSNCHILTNSPALHSLKRQQLVQLCKRNGIKASGKNAEMVEKLKAHALTHPLEPSSFVGQPFSCDDDDEDKENKPTGASRPSEVWSVIEEDSREVERVHLGLRVIREEVEQEMSNMSPLKGFGASSSGEFGNGTASSKGSSMTSSLKAFATSLKRGGSKTEGHHNARTKRNFNSTEPTPSIVLPMHAEEPHIFDTLTATSTPYHAHSQTFPNLPSPQPLNADDSRDQSMLDFGASTIRLVTTAPVAPSPPVLRPFTPTFEPSYSPSSPSVPTLYPSLPTEDDSDPLPPGGFPDTFSTPSGPPKTSRPAPQPFLFGSPAHHISNTQFNSATTSVLAEMNARLGLTGTANEVGLDLLQNRRDADVVPLPQLQDRPRTDVTSIFDKAHERQFQKMEGLGEWYARRTAASPRRSQDLGGNRKRKSDLLEGPHRRAIGPSNARARRTSRVVTPGTRRSLVAAAAAEDLDARQMKRVRISVVEGGDKKTGAADNKSVDESDDEDEETPKTTEERERERAAIKKKLEISRARRRSSMGRVSVGGGRPPLIPNQPKKGMANKFGFLSSAKSIVKSVWKGVGSGVTKQNSSMPVPGPSQRTVPPATKKPTPNVLTKAAPAAKPSVRKPPAAKAPTARPDPNASLRIPATRMGLGTGTSIRSSTSSATGTRCSTSSSGVTRSTTPSSASGIPAARRGAIPLFQQPLSRVSRTNSLASAGGTLGSRTSSSGTGSSRGTSAANSIGLKRPELPSAVRPRDVGKNSMSSIVRKRTSTLFAPTASSFAKMQSTVRPPSLTSAGSRPSAPGAESKTLAKVPEQKSPVSTFTFTSPPPADGGTVTPSRNGSIFSNGTLTFSPSQVPASETGGPKTRAIPARRPRISRSRVIARVGAQRAAFGSSLTRTPSERRSFNVPKTRGSLDVRVSGIGATGSARDSAAMSARQRLRQSEILRRRSKVSGVSPALLERDGTPDGGSGNSTEGEQSREDHGASLDVSMVSDAMDRD